MNSSPWISANLLIVLTCSLFVSCRSIPSLSREETIAELDTETLPEVVEFASCRPARLFMPEKEIPDGAILIKGTLSEVNIPGIYLFRDTVHAFHWSGTVTEKDISFRLSVTFRYNENEPWGYLSRLRLKGEGIDSTPIVLRGAVKSFPVLISEIPQPGYTIELPQWPIGAIVNRYTAWDIFNLIKSGKQKFRIIDRAGKPCAEYLAGIGALSDRLPSEERDRIIRLLAYCAVLQDAVNEAEDSIDLAETFPEEEL